MAGFRDSSEANIATRFGAGTNHSEAYRTVKSVKHLKRGSKLKHLQLPQVLGGHRR